MEISKFTRSFLLAVVLVATTQSASAQIQPIPFKSCKMGIVDGRANLSFVGSSVLLMIYSGGRTDRAEYKITKASQYGSTFNVSSELGTNIGQMFGFRQKMLNLSINSQTGIGNAELKIYSGGDLKQRFSMSLDCTK